MKYLDQGNLSNAYVSGMQEQLSMYGNEYTYAQTMYTVAYAVMQVPSTLIIQKIRPSIWLAVMEVAWGAFTFAQAGVHNVPELYAFRFLVGLFESSFFPALLYLLGSWYTKTELAKRVALFHMTAPLGTAFGGYLQAAVYENLNGAHGIEGWRWLYIVCGCMTVPVGLATFVVLPDTPYTTKVWFLSAEERELAIERVRRAGKAAPVKIRLATFKAILSSWKWYGFVIGYVVGSFVLMWLAKLSRIVIWIVMRRKRVLCHLAQVRELLRRRTQCHSYRDVSDICSLRCPLGVSVGLHREQVRLGADTAGMSTTSHRNTANSA